MAPPRFNWLSYTIDVPSRSPLVLLSKVKAVAPPAPGMTTIEIELPDLSGYSTPQSKADALLRVAAEVEHALLVQYLYATYSLKDPNDPSVTGLTDPQKKALSAWRTTIREIAREEMGHLLTVQNLRLLLDFEPTFERAEFPMLADVFPFDFHLGPMTQKTLAEYVVAESPLNDSGDPTLVQIIALATGHAGMPVNHVGILYGLLGVVFAASPEQIDGDASQGDPWYEMVRAVALVAYQQDASPGRWHLDGGSFDSTTLPMQASAKDWGMTPGGEPPPTPHPKEYRLWHAQDRDGAKAALRDIGLQGEGPAQGPPSGEKSHFDRFYAIYKGDGTVLPFPADGDWVPTYGVPTDPVISNDPTNFNAITGPQAQLYAALADARYALLLGLLGQYLVTEPARRIALKLPGLAIDEMLELGQSLSPKLVGLDRSTAGSGGGTAALPFSLPAVLHPLANEDDQRDLLIDRLHASITLGTIVASTYGDTTIKAIITEEMKFLQMLKSWSFDPSPGVHP